VPRSAGDPGIHRAFNTIVRILSMEEQMTLDPQDKVELRRITQEVDKLHHDYMSLAEEGEDRD